MPIERSSVRFLSLVLDARTRFVLGFEDGVAGPGGLLRALADAIANGVDGHLPASRYDGPPSLRAAMGRGPEWMTLRSVISRGFKTAFRISDEHRTGAFATRVLGGRLAWLDLSLVSRRDRSDWTRADVAYAVRAHNRSRLILSPELEDPFAYPSVERAVMRVRADPLVLAFQSLRDAVAASGLVDVLP